MKKSIVIFSLLSSLLVVNNVSAASFFFMGLEGDSIVLNDTDNNAAFSSPITEGSFTYDTALGTSSGSINVLNEIDQSNVFLHDMNITETSYGSLFLNAQMHYLGVSDVNVLVELIVDYNYDEINDVTTFALSTLDTDNNGVPGVQIVGSDFAGLSLDINATMSALAFVENDFPVYSPVPVPAAVWLFSSGLFALIGFSKRRTTEEEIKNTDI
ncbi:hypothetical protein MNBD_GAMMA08-629 [hydrothermal vent metagenome]|uniref:PEP-CTERM protein-sorting domain-containing protein n=1 Tax=hydrothermal vent metagenome TaxID=652676 RepID=A0A3B0WZZ0_9ZZZZ